MRYSQLVEIYKKLESTTKHLEKTQILAEFFKKIPESTLELVVHLLRGSVFPDWDERKIGFSDRLMIKAISKATGTPQDSVEHLWSKIGDLGKVASQLCKQKSQATLSKEELTIEKVTSNIKKLAEMEGSGTVDRKLSLVSELISNASAQEVRFIVGAVLGQLRVGIAAGILRDAIASAFNQDVKEVEHAFDLTADYGNVAKLAKNNQLSSVEVKPGKPIKSMLSLIAEDIDSIFTDIGSPVQLEFKLDGFRLQCHKFGNKIELFTRRLENVTKQFPDLVDALKKCVKAESFILDAEAVGYHVKTKKYLPFQAISQRIKRKYDIEEIAGKFPVELNIFDILYLNGSSTMNLVLEERRKLLESIIMPKSQVLIPTTKYIATTPKQITSFFKKAISLGTEGLMIKNLNSIYRPGRYVGGWLKLKKTLEPLDLVIIGAESGTGKRSGALSSYILACRDSSGKFLTCGMVSTGLKEKESEGTTFKQLTNLLKPYILKQEGRLFHIKPAIVIEVAYEEIQKSPTYTSGYALRFPRFLRLRTEEKSPKDCNTLEDIERTFNIQKRKL